MEQYIILNNIFIILYWLSILLLMERGNYIKLSFQIPSKRLVQTGDLIDQLYYNPSGQNKCAPECRGMIIYLNTLNGRSNLINLIIRTPSIVPIVYYMLLSSNYNVYTA